MKEGELVKAFFMAILNLKKGKVLQGLPTCASVGISACHPAGLRCRSNREGKHESLGQHVAVLGLPYSKAEPNEYCLQNTGSEFSQLAMQGVA